MSPSAHFLSSIKEAHFQLRKFITNKAWYEKQLNCNIRCGLICIVMNCVYSKRDTRRQIWCIKCSPALQTRISWSNALLNKISIALDCLHPDAQLSLPALKCIQKKKEKSPFICCWWAAPSFTPHLGSAAAISRLQLRQLLRQSETSFHTTNHSTTSSPSWSQSCMCFLILLACRGIHSQCPQLRNLGQ